MKTERETHGTATLELEPATFAEPATVRTREGATAEVVAGNSGEALRVRDARGRTIFQYDVATGRAVLSVPEGDLTLAAPHGNIDLVAGGAVRCKGRYLSLVFDDVRVVAKHLETVAARVIKRARAVYRRVEGVCDLVVGRTRTLVRGTAVHKAGETIIKADGDVRVDGRRIYLG